jgi:hypothetical protein
MAKLLWTFVLLASLYSFQATQAAIGSWDQLQALQQLSGTPYPWTEWVKFRAALSGIDLSPPASASAGVDPDMADATIGFNDSEDDDDYNDDDDSEEVGPKVIEFLKRSAVAAEEGSGKKGKGKAAKKGKGKVTKLKPWEEALAAKKAAAAASTTTTPAPTTVLPPQISYEELVKAILAVQAEQASSTTTASPTPDPDAVDYKQLAEALLAANE